MKGLPTFMSISYMKHISRWMTSLSGIAQSPRFFCLIHVSGTI
jgi:hypothetical protein